MTLKFNIGDRFPTNTCNWFTIVETIPHPKGARARIVFDEINGHVYETVIDRKHIKDGSVRNPYYPSKLGVGCIGNVNTKQLPLEFNKWRGMLERCYDPNHIHHKNYGGRGVKVCDRWLCFEHFLEDLKNLQGYDQDRLDKLELDKDIIGNGKIYSPTSCILITPSENLKEMNKRKDIRRKELMSNYIYPATLLADFYKLSHREQYPSSTEYVYSTFTPRSNKYFPIADKVVVFGIQAFVKKYLMEYFSECFFNRPKGEVVNEYVRIVKYALGKENPDTKHIEELHDLGYLPLELKCLPEGSLAPIKVPILTLENTDPRFFWITNYFETIMSAEIWQPMTSATIAYQYRKLLDEYAIKTTGSTAGVEFQGHDFSMRGMSSLESAKASGAGHLLSFAGTDTIPAILYHEHFYNANVETELVGSSISATEHSVMCSYGPTNEFDLFKHLITEVYPNGFFSIVSDTWDFWKVVTEYLPKLKADIMGREGRVVIRPDSGDPVKIIVGKVFPRFADLEEAEEELYYEMNEEASEDCEGSYNCGNDSYVRRCQVGDKFYKITASFEYNRHDKTYYYVETGSVKKVEEFTPSAADKGLVQILWEIFGGTMTEQGYRLLDTHIGAIYGDSITLERAKQIVEGLEAKGFASTNIVFGIGSYTYQYNTRDTFGFAMKATWAQVNGEERLLFKDPKTDDGTKKSQRGRVMVFRGINGLFYQDGLFKGDCDQLSKYRDKDQLQLVFYNGFINPDAETSLAEIRERLNS